MVSSYSIFEKTGISETCKEWQLWLEDTCWFTLLSQYFFAMTLIHIVQMKFKYKKQVRNYCLWKETWTLYITNSNILNKLSFFISVKTCLKPRENSKILVYPLIFKGDLICNLSENGSFCLDSSNNNMESITMNNIHCSECC